MQPNTNLSSTTTTTTTSTTTSAMAPSTCLALSKGKAESLIRNNAKHNNFAAIRDLLTSGRCPQGTDVNLSLMRVTLDNIILLSEALVNDQCTPWLNIKLIYSALNDECAMVLATALRSGHCAPINNLHLGANLFSEEGIELLINSLIITQGSPLKINNISFSDDIAGRYGIWSPRAITDKSLSPLANLITNKNFPQGITIHIYGPSVTNKSALLLAAALQSGKAQENVTIKLERTRIGNIGTQAIAKALSDDSSPWGSHIYTNTISSFFNNRAKRLREHNLNEAVIQFLTGFNSRNQGNTACNLSLLLNNQYIVQQILEYALAPHNVREISLPSNTSATTTAAACTTTASTNTPPTDELSPPQKNCSLM